MLPKSHTRSCLPIRVEYRSTTPGKGLRWLAAGILWLVGNAARIQYGGGRPLPENFWEYVVGGGAVLGIVLLYALHNWWHQAILHTGRLQLVLADHPRDRRQFLDFTQKLDAHTKAYLRKEYGAINPLGYIEPQLRRVAWLRDLGVLNAAEARTLNTRPHGVASPSAPSGAWASGWSRCMSTSPCSSRLHKSRFPGWKAAFLMAQT